MATTPANLHEGFRDGRRAQAEALVRFLEDADRLPGIMAIHRAMRGAMDLRPRTRVLDAGCGIGLEAWRLAAGHPHAHVTGLDLNAELLRIARSRPATPADNLEWTEGDLTDLRLADASFDVVRTERVLMYLPDPLFEQVLDDVLRVVRPGGQLVLFELDYGATILPDAGHDEAVVRHAHQRVERSLPQPWAGRRLPGLLAHRGLRDVVAAPYAFAVSEPVWRRIVHDTLRATLDDRPDPALSAWLVDAEQVVADGGLPAVFTGILTTARVPA
jgi:ubiquinone/menaquinone biosynthesis C-methylase UbiE